MAFNKPASQSSTWTSNDNRWGAQFAVNGKSDCRIYAHEGPTATTDRQDNPWIKIDLQGTFLIKTVVVNPRNCKSLSPSILTQNKTDNYIYE